MQQDTMGSARCEVNEGREVYLGRHEPASRCVSGWQRPRSGLPWPLRLLSARSCRSRMAGLG